MASVYHQLGQVEDALAVLEDGPGDMEEEEDDMEEEEGDSQAVALAAGEENSSSVPVTPEKKAKMDTSKSTRTTAIQVCVYYVLLVYVCMYVYVYVCMYMCMYVCLFVCLYVYVCMHVCFMFLCMSNKLLASKSLGH